MLMAFGGSLLLMLLVLFTPLRAMFDLRPLNSTEWLEIVLLAVAPMVISELVKLGQRLFARARRA
jgi:Ca2+-transporting ATPase